MSRSIDERIVSMQFDNKDFEYNAKTTLGTLARLKESLNLSGATKGLEDINTSANKVDMNGLSNAVETVKYKFSALEVMAVTSLANITNSAVNAGKRIVSALTIDPIKTGFQEYETQINAIQTILANTESKGSTLKDVNAALDELNTYADKTIYNFTEMTRNIGTFTAAGVDLNTSVSAIKGIANLAAVSGSTSQQASTAMYQFSQALASGTVKLMDWNSVVNAGMGGQVFQDALKETARVHGIAIDDMIKSEGSFRETLQKGWLTSDILTETLSKFTGDLNESQLRTMGYTEEQIKSIIKMGKTANDAATKVKTFTQLFDTLKEAAQSGWTQSWEIIIGDFEEAKSLLTEISDTVGDMINKSSESRNNMLQGWKDLGGRTALIESFRNVFEGLGTLIKPISEAFRDIFPPITAKKLFDLTESLKNFTEKLKLSEKAADKVKRTFKGLFSIFNIVGKGLNIIATTIGNIITSEGVASLADLLLTLTASIGDFFTSLNENISTSGITKGLSGIVSVISDLVKEAVGSLDGLGNALSKVGNFISKVIGGIWDFLKDVLSWVSDNISAGDIFAGLAGGGIYTATKKFSGLMDEVNNVLNNLFGKKGGISKSLNIGEKFASVLSQVHDALLAFTQGIRIASLIGIASAIALLTSSLKTISTLDPGNIVMSLSTIAAMLIMLNLSFRSIVKSLKFFETKGMVKAGFSIIMIAEAIKILSDAIVKISDIPFDKLISGLFGVGIGLFSLTKGLKAINGIKINLSTSVAMLALAESCKILSNTLTKFGKMSWDKIAKGLIAMGGALGEFVIAISILNKTSGFKSLLGSTSILIAVQALDELSENLIKFGSMNWDEIGRGLTAMGGALLEVAGISGALGKISGFSGILGAGAIDIVILGLDKLANALIKFGGMIWDEVKVGLIAMGGALLEVASISGALGMIAGFSGILGAGAIDLTIAGLDCLANALKKFGSMSWDEIGRGLTAMGGALLEVASISGALGMIAGFSGILGAGTIDIVILGLDKLVSALQKFGSMSWDEIGRGLTAMGGALLEVSGASFVSGLSGLSGIVGAGTIDIAVQGLDKLATALQKFGSMNWDEIGRGLTAMGGALAETAIGGLANTLSLLGSLSISTVAEPLGVLADSVKKWVDVKIPDNLGVQLGILAGGISAFTFSGFGASALSTAAPGIGVMADSVKKWTGVTIPDGLGEKISSLSGAISAFTFSGFGASALSTAAPGVGVMADSVKKWSAITIPEGLEEGLKGIATGVQAFSFSFAGGWSIGAIVEPLGSLAKSIKKWNEVLIPEGLEEGLKDIAAGVEAFSFAFVGGWSLSSVIGPLSDLAKAVKKWNDVTIPENLSNKLKDLANGVNSFVLAFASGLSLGTVTGPLGDLAESIKKFNGVNVDNVKNASDSLRIIANAVNEIKDVDFNSVSKSINKLVSSLSDVEISTTNFSNIGVKMIEELINGFKSKISSFTNSANDIVNQVVETIKNKASMMNSVGAKLIDQLVSGINKYSSNVTKAVKNMIQNAVNAANGYYSSFYSAGANVAIGFAAGISANSYSASAKAAAMAYAAVTAAKKELDINSPSKVFYSIGSYAGIAFTNALSDYETKAYKSGSDMAKSAKTGLSDVISKIYDVVNNDMDVRPTIRPVIDLSDISSGVKDMNRMFTDIPNIGVMSNVRAISSLMNSNQNGTNDDVVYAINKLRKDLGNINGDTYNINGISTNDGEIADAIKTIVRAVKVERRV